MKLLKLLREIMDVKYLETPLFARQVFVSKSLCLSYNSIASRVNSRIQRWSADYRLAIAQSMGLKNEAAGPSSAKKSIVGSGFHSNYYGQGPDLVQMIAAC